MSGRFRMNDGDWICSDAQCGNVNFARRLSCNRCGKEKTDSSKKKKLGTEIGKVAAEKSRGLFSADDWQCNKCGNVNWARRQHCNMCNAPKYGELEERTGYGGGYNERENVEYIEREESDGEYDEFGRKKKQYRGKEPPDSADPVADTSKPKVVEPRKEEVEEEEDDDDDDDADLSKYDLSGWGDEDEEDNKTNDTTNKQRKRSQSRSRSSSRSRSNSRSSSSGSESPSRGPLVNRKRRHDDSTRSRSRSSSSDSRSSSKRRRSRSRSRSSSRDRSRSQSKSLDRSK